MPLLAYYIAPAQIQEEPNKSGVGGRAIKAVAEGSLQALVSDFEENDRKENLREAALEFHQVLQEGLRRSAIIPFSFPTLLDDESAVRAHLRERAGEYGKTLTRLQGTVQVEVKIYLPEPDSAPQRTGAEYLRSRQAQYASLADAAAKLRSSAGDLVRECRERNFPGGLRAFFLIGASDIENFRSQVQQVELPSQIHVRVSGPWPATEFLSTNDGAGKRNS